MSSIQVQSLPVQQSDLSLLPTIRIGNPPPDCLPLQTTPKTTLGAPRAITGKHRGASSSVREGRIRRRESLRQQPRKPSALPSHMVKEVLQTKLSKEKKERDQKRKEASGTDQDSDMTHSQSRYSSVSLKSSSPEASPTSPPASRRGKSKSKSKDIDWSDVTDPEERRRIQNRIAQRKFREKTRDNKEKAEREARNQQYAGNSYRTPTADDFLNDMESDGLPWGSINFGHAILRGHESEGRRSSGRGTYIADDSLPPQAPPTLTPVSAPAPYMMPYSQALPQAAPSFASSGTDDVYMEEANYTYAPVIQTFPPPPPHQ